MDHPPAGRGEGGSSGSGDAVGRTDESSATCGSSGDADSAAVAAASSASPPPPPVVQLTPGRRASRRARAKGGSASKARSLSATLGRDVDDMDDRHAGGLGGGHPHPHAHARRAGISESLATRSGTAGLGWRGGGGSSSETNRVDGDHTIRDHSLPHPDEVRFDLEAAAAGVSVSSYPRRSANRSHLVRNSRGSRNGRGEYSAAPSSPTYAEGLLDDHNGTGDMENAKTSATRTFTSQEEQVRADCSFFYTNLDDDGNNANGAANGGQPRPLTSRKRRPRWTRRGSRLMADDGEGSGEGDGRVGGEGLYYAASGEDGAMALDLEAARGEGGFGTGEGGRSWGHWQTQEARDAYLSRYESLNAHILDKPRVLLDDRCRHDLLLEEEAPGDHPSPRIEPVVSDSLQQSSLLYMNEESGRLQIRLPNDNVRLLIDPHLEPGIISVERMVPCHLSKFDPSDCITEGGGKQRELKDRISIPRLGDGNEEANLLDRSGHSQALPSKYPWRDSEPSYVLTVDDDLYRRLIKEMADSKLMCGLYYCCHQNERQDRVSIGVALFLLGLVFIFLIVNIYVYGGT